MDKKKLRALQAKGWEVGTVEEFLGLSEQQVALIELRLSLSRLMKEVRQRRKLTQEQTAKLIGSSQSRVAKIEAGDPSVSIYLQVRSLVALGASREELAAAMNS